MLTKRTEKNISPIRYNNSCPSSLFGQRDSIQQLDAEKSRAFRTIRHLEKSMLKEKESLLATLLLKEMGAVAAKTDSLPVLIAICKYLNEMTGCLDQIALFEKMSEDTLPSEENDEKWYLIKASLDKVLSDFQQFKFPRRSLESTLAWQMNIYDQERADVIALINTIQRGCKNNELAMNFLNNAKAACNLTNHTFDHVQSKTLFLSNLRIYLIDIATYHDDGWVAGCRSQDELLAKMSRDKVNKYMPPELKDLIQTTLHDFLPSPMLPRAKL